MEKKNKLILAISAAPNHDSNSTLLLSSFCNGARSEGVEIKHMHLYDLHLPYFNYGNRKAEPPDDPDNQDVRQLKNLLLKADGLVIASPVWNFSAPAILKNFLDRISYFGRVYKDQFKVTKKPNFTQLHCYYIFTTGAPWYGWPFDAMAYYTTKLTMWYYGAKNHGLILQTNCGNGSRNVVKDRPRALEKAYKKGQKFARKYIK